MKQSLDIMEQFHIPLSTIAFQQLNDIAPILQQLGNNNDTWTYEWKSGIFSVSKMYKHLGGPSVAHHLFRDLWKAASRIRHKIFFWLLLHDKISSRSLLKRKNLLLESYECALWQEQVEETSLHLLWDCQFALSCWDIIAPNRHTGVSAFDDIIFLKQCFPPQIAMDIVIMGC